MKEEKKPNTIIEVPQSENQSKESGKEEQNVDYDFVVSEAAVGSYEGVKFTVAGFEETEEDETKWETYLDIEKERFVDVEEGTIFNLNDQIKLKVVLIEKESDEIKGKIYFKALSNDE